MSVSKLNNSVVALYKEVGLQEYDALNSYVIDSRGYVRWSSPTSHFTLVDYENSEIRNFFEEKGFHVIKRSGSICLPTEKRAPLELRFLLTFTHDIVNMFGSKERLGNELVADLQEQLNLTFELRKVSEDQIGKELSEYVVKFNTGLDKALVSQDTIENLKDCIATTIKQRINKTPEFQ